MEGRLEVQAGLNKVLGFFGLCWKGRLVLFFVVLAFFVCLFLFFFKKTHAAMLAAAANDFWRDPLTWLPLCSSNLSLYFPQEVFQELHSNFLRRYFSF